MPGFRSMADDLEEYFVKLSDSTTLPETKRELKDQLDWWLRKEFSFFEYMLEDVEYYPDADWWVFGAEVHWQNGEASLEENDKSSVHKFYHDPYHSAFTFVFASNDRMLVFLTNKRQLNNDET